MNQEYNSGFTEPLQQKKSLPAAPLTLLLGINHTVKQCREKIERLNQDDKKKKDHIKRWCYIEVIISP